MSFPNVADQQLWPSRFLAAIWDFSLKFEDVVLDIVPAASWAILTPAIHYYYVNKPVYVSHGPVLWLKLLLSALLLFLEIATVAIRCAVPAYHTNITAAAAAVDIVSAVGIITVVYVEHRRGIRASALLSVYLTMGILIDGTRTRSYFIRDMSTLGGLAATKTTLRFVLLCVQEIPRKNLLIDPQIRAASGVEATSGFWSRTFFFFMTPLFRAGFKTILSVDDLGNLGIEFSSAHLFASLSSRWNRTKQERPHALFLACLRTWRAPLLAVAAPRLLSTGFIFAQPYVIRHMVLYHRYGGQESFKGGLVAATFLSYTGAAIAKTASMHLKNRLLTRVRGGLISQLFDKTSRLELVQAEKHAALTLMTTDLEGIATGLPLCVEIPFSVIETGLGIFLLTEFVRQATFIIFIPLILATCMGLVYGRHLNPALRHWNTAIETRVSKTAHVLSQLPGIKMLGLAPQMAEYLQSLRIQEIKASHKYRYIQAASISTAGFLDMSAPVIVIAGALFWRVFGPKISSDVIFPALGLITLVQSPITDLLKSYPSAMAMLGCFERIQDYLKQEEHVDPRIVLGPRPRDITRYWPTRTGDTALSTRTVQRDASRIIHFENASIAAIGMEGAILSNLTLSIPPHCIALLLGPTGSGKTTIFESIIGENQILDGIVYVDEMSIALCGQQLWLTNGTIRECIIGGFEYDHAWYLAVITACELVFDINQFEEGNDYLIGSDGIRLSGGQRQRLCIARAVYARASIVLLDDSFSALDMRTARAILHNLCNRENGLLRQSNCAVLLTNYVPESLQIADELLLLKEDGVLSQMPITQIDGDSMAFVEALLASANRAPREEEEGPRSPQWDSDSESDSELEGQSPSYAPQATAAQLRPDETTRNPESRQKGNKNIYWLWMNQVGRQRLAWWFVIVLVMCLAEGFPTIYMKWWIELSPANNIWFIGYALLSLTAGLLGGPCVFLMMIKLSPRASIELHGMLTGIVMRCTIGFLGATDSGSILNRYSVDMDLIAKQIPAGLYNNLYLGITTLIQVGIALSGANYMAATLPILIGILFFVQRYYLRTSRQLRHLDIESQAPLATAFREAADGLVHIRAFNWQAYTTSRALRFLDQSQKPFYLLSCAQQTLSLVLDSVSSSLATILAVLTLYIKDSSTENSSGLSFLVLIVLGTSFNRTIMTWTTLETALGSLSRLLFFFEDTPVESANNKSLTLPDHWPSQGEVQIHNLRARYICDTERFRQTPVLRNITLSVEPGQKVGIMGRTGSGKSSLLMTLLGFLDYEGSIYVDGVDLRTVSRDELRSRIITISQDQVELDGTIRDNLLPFDKTWTVGKGSSATTAPSDEVAEKDRQAAHDRILKETLIQLGLWESLVGDAENRLDIPLAATGFSHGETQLMCIARAVVRRRIHGGRLVLVDESTGGVDMWRDRIVREMMRDHFRDCTILIVAHRAESIADSNVNLRMMNGRIAKCKKYI